MRVTNGTFLCSFCGQITIPMTLEPLDGVENVTVELDDDGTPPYVQLNMSGGRGLRHDCKQIPADMLAQLEEM